MALKCKGNLVLDFNILFRKGSEQNGCVVHESHSCDFTINGESLLCILGRETGGHNDFLGCFARGWDNLNNHSLKQLLLKAEPETDSGRSLVYVCPECADIDCGAYGCRITKSDTAYIWSDFAYENGYEDPQPILGVGPFEFSVKNYELVMESAYAL
jgi:hypothetical protein